MQALINFISLCLFIPAFLLFQKCIVHIHYFLHFCDLLIVFVLHLIVFSRDRVVQLHLSWRILRQSPINDISCWCIYKKWHRAFFCSCLIQETTADLVADEVILWECLSILNIISNCMLCFDLVCVSRSIFINAGVMIIIM